MSDLYASYTKFKSWSGTVESDPREHAEFMRTAGKSGRLKLLEVGFGAASFLSWASQMHDVHGVEIIPELVTAAQNAGLSVSLGTIEQVDNGPYDVIFAIDVLEHLDLDQLRSFMHHTHRLLKPQGRLVARFPNGGSPFGRAYQHGDLTHKLALTESAIHQLALEADLTLVKACNLRPAKGIKRALAYLARDVIGQIVSYAFYNRYLPMDGNLVVVLERP